jgi:hypothetical protein
MHRPEMADTHHLHQTSSIVAIRFDGPGRQKMLRMSNLDANCLESGFCEMVMQPFGNMQTAVFAREISRPTNLRMGCSAIEMVRQRI